MVGKKETAQTAAASAVMRLAQQLTLALETAEKLGVLIDIEIEEVAIAGRKPLRQVMAYVRADGS